MLIFLYSQINLLCYNNLHLFALMFKLHSPGVVSNPVEPHFNFSDDEHPTPGRLDSTRKRMRGYEGEMTGDLDIQAAESGKRDTKQSSKLKELLVKQRASISMKYASREHKDILKGISLYFNPGELIGIMGPSGLFASSK